MATRTPIIPLSRRKTLDALLSTFDAGGHAISGIIANAVAEGRPQSGYWTAKLSQVRNVYTALTAQWAVHGAELMEASAASFGAQFAAAAGRGASAIHTEAIRKLIENSVSLVAERAENGIVLTGNLFKLTQQMIVSEQDVDRALIAGLTEKGTPAAQARSLYETLVTKGQLYATDGKLVAGSKTFDARDYAELTARTRTAEAASQAAVDQARAAGISLQVVPADPCPQCEPIAWKVYAPDEAEEVLPVHPRCECIWAPYL